MKQIIAIAMLLAPSIGICEDVLWQTDSAILEDFDCDGNKDKALLGYTNRDVIVKLSLSTHTEDALLTFGLSDPNRQDALCADSGMLGIYPATEEVLTDLLGELPEGYKTGEGCFNLSLDDGQCDSIRIYWNHDKKAMNWWRR